MAGAGLERTLRAEGGDYMAVRRLRLARLELDGRICQLRRRGCQIHADRLHHLGWPVVSLELADVVSCCRSCGADPSTIRAQ